MTTILEATSKQMKVLEGGRGMVPYGKKKKKEVCGADSAVGPPFTRDLGWKVEAGGRGDEKKLAVSTSYYVQIINIRCLPN